MRCAGRMDPGSGAAVCTGQAVFFMPALTAITRAMLSFLVRPLMVGTAIGGSAAAESLPFVAAVLDAVPRIGAPADEALGVLDATANAGPVDEAVLASLPSWFPLADARASLPAQPNPVASERLRSATEEYLLSRIECISL